MFEFIKMQNEYSINDLRALLLHKVALQPFSYRTGQIDTIISMTLS